jgi:hypothetical protein
MRGLPAIVVVVIVVAFIVSTLVVGVVHVVAESVGIVTPTLDLANTISDKSCNILRHIFNILHAVIPLAVFGTVVVVLNVLRDVFDLSDLFEISQYVGCLVVT